MAEIIAQAQALNEAMKALKESIKDQPQTEASSKFINEDQAQKMLIRKQYNTRKIWLTKQLILH